MERTETKPPHPRWRTIAEKLGNPELATANRKYRRGHTRKRKQVAANTSSLPRMGERVTEKHSDGTAEICRAVMAQCRDPHADP